MDFNYHSDISKICAAFFLKSTLFYGMIFFFWILYVMILQQELNNTSINNVIDHFLQYFQN
jgi:diacylglycerol kinase